MSERMQALLSRAVEDQLSEQRQLAGALNEIRALIARLPAEVAAASGGAPQQGERLDAVVAGVDGLTQELRGAVRLLGERVDGVHRLVQQRGEDLAALGARLDRLEHHLNSHAAALDGVRSGLEALPALPERLGALGDSVGALHERVAGLEDLRTAVDALGGQVTQAAEVRGDVAALAAAVDSHGERMAALATRADVESLRQAQPQAEPGDGVVDERLATLDERLAGLSERLAGLEEGVRPLADLTGGAETTRTTLEAVAGDVRDVLARLEAEPAAEEPTGPDVGEELAALSDAVAALSERVDSLAARPATQSAAVEVDSVVRAATADSERRLKAHVDEAVLALAEALLRRRRPAGRPLASGSPGAVPEAGAEGLPAGVAMPDDLEPGTSMPGTPMPDTPMPDTPMPDDLRADDLEEEPVTEPDAVPRSPEETAQGAAAALAELAGEDAGDETAAADTFDMSRFLPGGAEPGPGDVLPAGEGPQVPPAGPDTPARKRKPWWRPAD